jgi:purine-nucleoside phosphorylase
MNYPTWSDLNNESIVPPLGARQAPDIGPVAVLVSTEPDIRYLRATSGKQKEQLFFMGTLMSDEKHGISIAGPYIGAPYGVMLLESLIVRGAKEIIVLGWCGALTNDLAIGDLIIPDHAIVDEGTSRNYKVLDQDLPFAKPDPKLSDQLFHHLTPSGLSVGRHSIWTTDAIYRETPKKVAWFKDKGAKAVEMECSSLFAVAEYRKVAITALLVVSDSLESESGDWDPGFRKKNFKEARKSACNSLITFARNLCDHGKDPETRS